jgi:hypothetical protein
MQYCTQYCTVLLVLCKSYYYFTHWVLYWVAIKELELLIHDVYCANSGGDTSRKGNKRKRTRWVPKRKGSFFSLPCLPVYRFLLAVD